MSICQTSSYQTKSYQTNQEIESMLHRTCLLISCSITQEEADSQCSTKGGSEQEDMPSTHLSESASQVWKLNASKLWPDSGHSFANHRAVSLTAVHCKAATSDFDAECSILFLWQHEQLYNFWHAGEASYIEESWCNVLQASKYLLYMSHSTAG